MIAYAKTKGNSGYPNISYNVWLHVACQKLEMKEDLASVYIKFFLCFTDDKFFAAILSLQLFPTNERFSEK